MTDFVYVTGLALHAFHGVMEHEATVGQTFYIDLVLDIDLTQASRSDKIADTVGYDQVVDVASRIFLRPALPAGRGRRRGHRRCHAHDLPRGHVGAGDGAQATRSDRRDILRRRRDDRPQAVLAMSEALIALGGNVGDVRDTLREALAMLGRGPNLKVITRSPSLSDPGLGREGPAAVHQLLRSHRNHAEPA